MVGQDLALIGGHTDRAASDVHARGPDLLPDLHAPAPAQAGQGRQRVGGGHDAGRPIQDGPLHPLEAKLREPLGGPGGR